MSKHGFCHLLFVLTIGSLAMVSCKGQENPTTQIHKTEESARVPKIIGTPPPQNPGHNPYNDSGLVSQYIRCIFQDSKGQYWFGPAGQSVARFDGSTLEYYSMEEFFRGNGGVTRTMGNSVHAIAEDNHGNMWFGTEFGVVRYDGMFFKSYSEEEGLSNTQIGRRSILVDRDGTIWVGNMAGVFRYLPFADKVGGKSFVQFDRVPKIRVKDIVQDKAGNIWFASEEKGVFRYDGDDVKNFTQKEGLGDNVAGGIFEDPEGKIWFTMRGGICRYDGKTFTEYTTDDGIGGSDIWGINGEKSGIIWITARGSTTRFDPSLPTSDPEAFKVFEVEDGINCCVQSMYRDRKGDMWWGTGQGLYRFDGERFYQVKQKGPW